jgi:hypothetical protein
LQNTFIDLPVKLDNQKYIYLVDTDCMELDDYSKNIIKNNNKLIDFYFFITNNIKNNFEKYLFKIDNGYVIENVIPQIINNKKEISKLFVSCGFYDEISNYSELITEFSKFNKSYKLEIYGNIRDINYYNKLKKYIVDNQLNNIILFDNTYNYIERLKEAEYFCLLSKPNDYIYLLSEAISLNKKIVCLEKCVTFDQIKWYPSKYVYKKNDLLFNWFQIKKTNYLPYSFFHFKEPIINLSNPIVKNKIGNTKIDKIEQVLEDLNTYNKRNIQEKNGYSFLLRIKDEEDTIEKCVLDIVDLADEIIIVNNNSKDNTLNIIKKLEQMYKNIFVYEYNIDIPRYGSEHIENFKRNDIHKNNTLANYYNWTVSKATYNKKIKWDGDFYCIRNNLKLLLDKFRDEANLLGVHFSGITLFINNDKYYIKNNSFYNEYRLFLNLNNNIWNDNIYNNDNYCEQSESFISIIQNKYIYTLPIFIEIKNTNKDEFLSRSIIMIDDNRDNIDRTIINNLKNNIDDINIIETNNLFYDINMFKSFIGNPYNEFFNNDYIKLNSKVVYYFKKIKSVLLIYDSHNWSFHNIIRKIIHFNKKYNIDITTSTELYNKISNNFNNLRNNYDYCNINLNYSYDILCFFFYGDYDINILNYYKKFTKIKIFLCIYDYTLWTNNHNKSDELIYCDRFKYFLNNINGMGYSCPAILTNINNKFTIDLVKYKCYDGIDTKLFYFQGYKNDILDKKILTIGWIGNSNPQAHGINKGFQLIKKTLLDNDIKDKFIFLPQDIYTGTTIDISKIPNYISKIDIIVCFSIGEGTPNQILECSSSGKCWISTNVGIVSELYNTIDNNPCGLIINRDTTELKNALFKLYDNRNLIVEYGLNGRKAIEKCWDWSIKIQQYYDIFDSNNNMIGGSDTNSKYKDIIIKRTNILREKLSKKSNRERVDFLKNYYLGKTAIIVGTGPDYKNQIDIIKNNFNENCILICIKQSIKDFDMICDFHIYNHDHFELYKYGNFKPIILFMNYSKPDINNYRTVYENSDINFFLHNLNNCEHKNKNILHELKNDNDLFLWNDKNLGLKENMVSNGTHIIFEIAFPLAISIGCKNIITNGWVGGSNHGTVIKNELSWDLQKYKYLVDENNKEIELSGLLGNYLYNNYNVHIFSLGKTLYKIEQIIESDFINIINYRELFIISLINNDDYDIGNLVRYIIKVFDKYNVTTLFIKNGLKILTYKNYNKYFNNLTNISVKTNRELLDKIQFYLDNNYFKNNCIFYGIHPRGMDIINALKYNSSVKKVIWLNDPHYLALTIKDRTEKNIIVQQYKEKYNIDIFDDKKIDYLITPSPIYFKNLKITKYDDQIKFLFYLLNPDDYNQILINNYNERENKVVLSGAIGGGYKTRIEIKNLLDKDDQFKNLIYYQVSPGYKNNEHMTCMNYYNKLAKYKGAFVGHHIFPLNFLLAKHIEILMCGCLGFFESNPLLKSELGLIEFEHYIPCSDKSGNLINDFNFYNNWLKDEKAEKIALNGAKYVREKFGEKYLFEYINFFKNI